MDKTTGHGLGANLLARASARVDNGAWPGPPQRANYDRDAALPARAASGMKGGEHAASNILYRLRDDSGNGSVDARVVDCLAAVAGAERGAHERSDLGKGARLLGAQLGALHALLLPPHVDDSPLQSGAGRGQDALGSRPMAAGPGALVAAALRQVLLRRAVRSSLHLRGAVERTLARLRDGR